jgi:hypothetical protein
MFYSLFRDLPRISWVLPYRIKIQHSIKNGGIFMNEREKTIFMSEQEKTLLYKTSIILRKDTSKMSLNDIIEELVHVIESKKSDRWPNQE